MLRSKSTRQISTSSSTCSRPWCFPHCSQRQVLSDTWCRFAHVRRVDDSLKAMGDKVNTTVTIITHRFPSELRFSPVVAAVLYCNEDTPLRPPCSWDGLVGRSSALAWPLKPLYRGERYSLSLCTWISLKTSDLMQTAYLYVALGGSCSEPVVFNHA